MNPIEVLNKNVAEILDKMKQYPYKYNTGENVVPSALPQSTNFNKRLLVKNPNEKLNIAHESQPITTPFNHPFHKPNYFNIKNPVNNFNLPISFLNQNFMSNYDMYHLANPFDAFQMQMHLKQEQNKKSMIETAAMISALSGNQSIFPAQMESYISNRSVLSPNTSLNKRKTSGQLSEIYDSISNQKSRDSLSDDSKPDSIKEIKILRDPSLKYPLECSWSFWFFKNNREYDWKENLTLLTTVDTVEDFWSVYIHLRPVESLQEGCDYMLFKKDIKPMWEDPKNIDGGRWLVTSDKEQRSNELSKNWLNSLLSLIGSHYDEDDEVSYVNGAFLNIRFKTDRLELWTSCCMNEKAQLKIGRRFKRTLGIQAPILYEIHDQPDPTDQSQDPKSSDENKAADFEKTDDNSKLNLENGSNLVNNQEGSTSGIPNTTQYQFHRHRKSRASLARVKYSL